jgi:paraquat-inducible protein A
VDAGSAMTGATTARLGLLACHDCGLVSRPPRASAHARCARCGAALHTRKPYSIGRTSAFLIAAALLYIPANVLPVMQSSTLFGTQEDTILSGVVYLWSSGSWPLAVVVFVASITVPLLKIIALTVLVMTAQRRTAWRPHERTRLYRVIELVGRWSMLDIYVVTVLVALVHLQGLATIQAGPGAVAFGAVVVLTMLASLSFDPRLIWDPIDERHG